MATPVWETDSDVRPPVAAVWLRLGYRRIGLLMLHVQVAQLACQRAADSPAAQQRLLLAREELEEAIRTDC